MYFVFVVIRPGFVRHIYFVWEHHSYIPSTVLMILLDFSTTLSSIPMCPLLNKSTFKNIDHVPCLVVAVVVTSKKLTNTGDSRADLQGGH